MSANSAAVAIVPRDRLSLTPRSVESVAAAVPEGTDIVCVDVGMRGAVRRATERAGQGRVRMVTTARFATPGAARNLAVTATEAEHLVLVENDVLVQPGFVEALVACAEETGAWLVAPLTLAGEWEHARIHVAGARLELGELDGRRIIDRECALREGEDPVAARPFLHRERIDVAEFHCVLVRRRALDEIGSFDERITTVHDATDLSLRVRAAGGEVWLEPSAVVTHLAGPWPRWGDRRYYSRRWSERSFSESVERLEAVHDLGLHPRYQRWQRRRRLRVLGPLARGFIQRQK